MTKVLALVGLVAIAASSPAQRSEPARQLASLLQERLVLARQVAMSKYNTGAPVEDRVREKALLASVERQAKTRGIRPAFARNVFQAQIEASKMVQRELIRQWSGSRIAVQAPDLKREVRPKLDRLTVEILDGLVRISPLRSTAAGRRRIKRAFGNVAWSFRERGVFEKAWSVATDPVARR